MHFIAILSSQSDWLKIYVVGRKLQGRRTNEMAGTIETFANISAQDLLRRGFTYYGWVRKADSTGIRKMLHMCKYISVEEKNKKN